jgi:beta-lactamase superfamily II metal-dependent hydrolase
MMELYDAGNSFVIQLKNGHFLLNDGGTADDLPYLLDYLESLVPEGEIPVIEAWILTHAHHDHMGLFEMFSKHPEYGKRIYVEGVYYNEIDGNTAAKVGGAGASNLNRSMTLALNGIKTSNGGEPQVYRPQTGQRYYLNDVTIDIVFAQEQLISDNYYVEVDNLNDSSTWCMYTIEGQKFLLCGDASRGSMQSVMRTYESEYLDLDMFAIFHHGINSWPTFTDYMSAKTVLFTFAKTHSQRDDIEMGSEANNLLIERAKDYYAWGDGTVVFTFPYAAGTAKTLKPNDWKYHEKREPSWLAWYPDYASKYVK